MSKARAGHIAITLQKRLLKVVGTGNVPCDVTPKRSIGIPIFEPLSVISPDIHSSLLVM